MASARPTRWAVSGSLALLALLALSVAAAAQASTGPTGTSPAGARSAKAYDLGPIVGKGSAAPARLSQVVQAVATALDRATAAEPDAVEVLNGTRLVIRAGAAEHAAVAQLLEALRRNADVRVTIRATLYEVDDAFHTALTNVPRIPLDELERRFLAGDPPGDDLFRRLDREKPVQTGPELTLDNGEQAVLLSRQRAALYGPSPEQARHGDRGPQVVLEGVSFVAAATVSPDRRFVRVKLAERAATIDGVAKVPADRVAPGKAAAETVFLREDAHSGVRDIPDGGSLLVPVHYRPTAVRDRKRWWVLSVTARIRIPEEEKQVRDPAPLPHARLPVGVRDRQGNLSRIERTFSLSAP